MPEPVEESVIIRAIEGDREAFSEIYSAYVTRIYNYIYYRTGNEHDAEDLTARVFNRAMSGIRSYQHRGLPFSAWLYRIAHNLVANWHRDNSRRKEYPLEDHIERPSEGQHLEHDLISIQESDRLMAAIKTLSGERQQLVILKFVERLSNAEIAQIMRRSEGAIKSLYHRTLIALRDELDR